ncbi:MAG: hypothetical protein EBY30_09735, partial [Rhodospirillales bacterium]|nr:hypothetical protein [Rhodospirillales bacterium]
AAAAAAAFCLGLVAIVLLHRISSINDALNRAISDPQVISKLADIGMLTAERLAPQAADDFARNGFTAVRDKLRELGLETQ